MKQQIATAQTVLWERFPRKPDGGVLFDGMDDWLWELYEGHRPRPSTLSSSREPQKEETTEGELAGGRGKGSMGKE